MSKIGRNDPCPCGSGKKYKKCCIPAYDNSLINTGVSYSKDFIKRNSEKGVKLLTNYGEKMSEIIIDFAEPLLELIPDEKEAYPLAITAWNASLFPEDEQLLIIDKLVTSGFDGDTEFQEILKTLLVGLMLKKQHEYPDNKRFIIDYEFVETATGSNFNVMSTIMEPK